MLGRWDDDDEAYQKYLESDGSMFNKMDREEFQSIRDRAAEIHSDLVTGTFERDERVWDRVNELSEQSSPDYATTIGGYMAKVYVKVAGGSVQEKNASTVGELKSLVSAEGYVASVNRDPAGDEATLRDEDFVSLAKPVKAG